MYNNINILIITLKIFETTFMGIISNNIKPMWVVTRRTGGKWQSLSLQKHGKLWKITQ